MLPTGYFPKLSESRFMVIAGNGPSDPSQRQTSERKQHKSVSKVMQDASTHGYYKIKAQSYQSTFPTLSIRPANRLIRTLFGTSRVRPQEYHHLHETAVV